MSAETYALDRIAADLVAAGLSALLAPTPAREALDRIKAGEEPATVMKAVVSDWSGLTASTVPPVPVPTKAPPAEPQRRVLYTVAGHVPLKSGGILCHA